MGQTIHKTTDFTVFEELAVKIDNLASQLEQWENRLRSRWDSVHPQHQPSAKNLVHYTALRSQDITELQFQLAKLGLSSLGRSESHVLYTVQALQTILHRLNGQKNIPLAYNDLSIEEGNELLKKNTVSLLGPAPTNRYVRIMVTLSSEVADDPELVRRLLMSGMNCARINTAHDNVEIWEKMAFQVKVLSEELNLPCKILVDLGGPKLRTGNVPTQSDIENVYLETGLIRKKKSPAIKLKIGEKAILDTLNDVCSHSIKDEEGNILIPARIACPEPEIVKDIKPGHRILLDDGKIEGVVDWVQHQEIGFRITHCKKTKAEIASEKGINFPDTDLCMRGLTRNDKLILESVIHFADIISLSFVQDPKDIWELQQQLEKLNALHLGIVIKLETKRSFGHLPDLLMQLMHSKKIGVMIARGDLAVETGWVRLAEIQEEILWFCEAAHVPVIWATQVLETLAKKGLPSRAEITDAAMSQRAECVMLNKGPYIERAIVLLEEILSAMQRNQFKKSPRLRKLSISKTWSQE